MKKFKEVLAESSRSGGGMMPQYGRYPWDTSADAVFAAPANTAQPLEPVHTKVNDSPT